MRVGQKFQYNRFSGQPLDLQLWQPENYPECSISIRPIPHVNTSAQNSFQYGENYTFHIFMEHYQMQDFRSRNVPLVSLCCHAAQFHQVPQKNIKNVHFSYHLRNLVRKAQFCQAHAQSPVSSSLGHDQDQAEVRIRPPCSCADMLSC